MCLNDSLHCSLREAIVCTPCRMAILSDLSLWVESKQRLTENELESDQDQEADKPRHLATAVARPGSHSLWFTSIVCRSTQWFIHIHIKTITRKQPSVRSPGHTLASEERSETSLSWPKLGSDPRRCTRFPRHLGHSTQDRTALWPPEFKANLMR